MGVRFAVPSSRRDGDGKQPPVWLVSLYAGCRRSAWRGGPRDESTVLGVHDRQPREMDRQPASRGRVGVDRRHHGWRVGHDAKRWPDSPEHPPGFVDERCGPGSGAPRGALRRSRLSGLDRVRDRAARVRTAA